MFDTLKEKLSEFILKMKKLKTYLKKQKFKYLSKISSF